MNSEKVTHAIKLSVNFAEKYSMHEPQRQNIVVIVVLMMQKFSEENYGMIVCEIKFVLYAVLIFMLKRKMVFFVAISASKNHIGRIKLLLIKVLAILPKVNISISKSYC